MPRPRYTLVPGWIDVDVSGWELTGYDKNGDRFIKCHRAFDATDDNADIEAAANWAEGIIGARQNSLHVRERGFDRWEAGTRD